MFEINFSGHNKIYGEQKFGGELQWRNQPKTWGEEIRRAKYLILSE